MHSSNPEEIDRAHRLFELLDEDHGGSVDVMELAHALKHSEAARELASGFAPLAELVAVASERRRSSKRRKSKRRGSSRRSKRRSTMQQAFDPAAIAAMAEKVGPEAVGKEGADAKQRARPERRRSVTLSRAEAAAAMETAAQKTCEEAGDTSSGSAAAKDQDVQLKIAASLSKIFDD